MKLVPWIFTWIALGLSGLAVAVQESDEYPRLSIASDVTDSGRTIASHALADGRPLLSGLFGLRARIRLPVAEDKVAAERASLVLTHSGSAVVLTPSVDSTTAEGRHRVPNLLTNLLGADELWVTYRTRPDVEHCDLSGWIEGRGEPFLGLGEASAEANMFRLSSRQIASRRIDVGLEGGRASPRDQNYLIRRQLGMHGESDWHFVDDGKIRVYMRLLRVDLRRTERLELVLNSAIERVNLRLSLKGSGRPTDVLEWDAIPKDVLTVGGQRVARLDIGAALRERWPESLQTGSPLRLVELVAHSYRGRLLDIAEAPIKRLSAFYAESGTQPLVDAIPVMAHSERIGPELWRWRMSLSELRQHQMREAKLLQAQVTGGACVARFEKAETVRLVQRKLPSVFAAMHDKVRAWGGPFGLANNAIVEEIEWPKLLAHVPLAMFSAHDGRTIKIEPGVSRTLDAVGLRLSSHESLAAGMSGTGLSLRGRGEVELAWAPTVQLPEHAFLYIGIDDRNAAEVTRARVRLRFSEGRNEIVPVGSGGAVDLSRFYGKRIVGIEWLLALHETGAVTTITEVALFAINVVSPEDALKLPVATLDWVEHSKFVGLANSSRETWSLTHAMGVTAADLGVVRLEHGLSMRPLNPCWLTLTVESISRTSNKTVCPDGLLGETVLSVYDTIFDEFSPEETISRIHWQVVDGALPVGGGVWLQASYARLSTPSVAARLQDGFTAQFAGATYKPLLSNVGLWQELLAGHAWLDYGDIIWPGGAVDFHKSHYDTELGNVVEWQFISRAGLDDRLKAWLYAPIQVTDANGAYTRWLKLGLLLLVFSLGVLLWRRGAVQRWTFVLRHHSKQLINRLLWIMPLLTRGLQVFVVKQRQTINALVPALAWLGWIRCLAECEPEPFMESLPAALLWLTLFAGINAWRWRLQTQGRVADQKTRRWLLGERNPPLILWVAVVIQVAFSLYRLDTDVWRYLPLLNEMGSTDVIIGVVGIMLSLVLLMLEASDSWLPTWLAIFYGFLPWVVTWFYWLTTTSARFILWVLVAVGLYAIGLTQLGVPGENYYFTFGAMVVVVVWRVGIGRWKTSFEERWPDVARNVYGGAGSIYFSGAFVGLIITALLLALGVTGVAEQVAMVVYYCLIVGAILEIAALQQAKRFPNVEETPENDEKRV